MVYLCCLFAGMVLGLFYFGGLWWTTKKALTARRPALLFILSFIGRNLLALAAFYFIMGGRWQRLLFALGGFIPARLLIKDYILRKKD